MGSNDAEDCHERIVSRYFQQKKQNSSPQSERALLSSYQQARKARLSSPSTQNKSVRSSAPVKNKTNSAQTRRLKCYVVQMDGVEKVVSPYFDIPEGANFICEKQLKCSNSKQKRRIETKCPSEGNNEDEDEVAVDVEDVNRYKKRKKQLSAEEKKLDAYKRVPKDHNFKPPYSCHHLLQEKHCYDPWRVLVISMLLNVTTGGQVAKVLPHFFSLCPNAETTIRVDVGNIANVIRSLGVYKKRAELIKRFSSRYLQSDWTHVTQLPGVGKYVADAYATFCNGMLEGVRPQDHKLVDYWKFVYPDKLA